MMAVIKTLVLALLLVVIPVYGIAQDKVNVDNKETKEELGTINWDLIKKREKERQEKDAVFYSKKRYKKIFRQKRKKGLGL